MTDEDSLPLFKRYKCPHCNVESLLKIVARYMHTVANQDDEPEYYYEYEYLLQLLLCEKCNSVSLVADLDDYPSEIQLFPSEDKTLASLPPQIAKAYEAAQRVRRIDINAFAVLLGRVLDLVCADRGAKGKTLHAQLQSLAESGEIPGRLADMAHQLRNLRNIGAHANLGSLTAAEVPFLDQLCRTVLEYVYEAPKFLARVEDRLARLKKMQETEEPE